MGTQPSAAEGLSLSGDPRPASGATWTFRASVGGVDYDPRGVLFVPSGNGPSPAVIIPHPANGNANGNSRAIARIMVDWDLVAIALSSFRGRSPVALVFGSYT